jgi:hypothetical protein
MPIVRCDRCRFSFEVKETGAAPPCRQCGGTTQPVDPNKPRRRETAKTLKIPAVPKASDSPPLVPPPPKTKNED